MQSTRSRGDAAAHAEHGATAAALAPLSPPKEAPAPAAHLEQGDDEAPVCRICWAPEDGSSPGGRLLTGTCACTGSQRTVHAACLLQWLRTSRHSTPRGAAAPASCPTCLAAVTLPRGLERSVRLPPRWQQQLEVQWAEARRRPARTAYRLWNVGVVACAAAHGAAMGCRAWIGAPAAASRLGTAAAPPPLQRWGLLPSVACAAAVQAAWGPGTIGRHEARWLVGHAGAFAAGLLLEGCAGRMQAQHAAAAPPPAGRPAAGRALPTILGTAALVLQAAGLQHLSPFLHFTQGYQLGLHRAFEWTAQALLLPFALLGRGGGGGGHVASALLRLLPALAHGFYRALRMGG